MYSKPVSAVELAQTLIAFNTINPPGNESDCVAYLADLLCDAGFYARFFEFAPGRTSLVARLSSSLTPPRRPLCFAGHTDTVPLGQAPWHVDPFSGVIRDGKLYGRGSSDMKSGIAAFVTAALDTSSCLKKKGHDLILAIVAGEETGCLGSNHLAELPDSEKAAALGKAGAVIIAEPTGNRPLVGHKGALWLTARFHGISAHGSMPMQGDNAIYKAARAVCRLQQFDFDTAPHPYMGSPTLNVGTISGGMNINSVPDAAAIGIDIRTVAGQDHTRLIQRLTQYLGSDAELTPEINEEAVWTDPDDPWVQDVFELVTPIFNHRPGVETISYFTDAAALKHAFGDVPTLIFGPGDSFTAHQTDEYCELRRIDEAVAAYSAIIRNWYGV